MQVGEIVENLQPICAVNLPLMCYNGYAAAKIHERQRENNYAYLFRRKY